MITDSSAINKAKAILLTALDQLEQAEQSLGQEPERVDLIVIYEIGRDTPTAWESISGWASTPGPKWMHSAMLQRAADAQHDAASAIDNEPEDDDQ